MFLSQGVPFPSGSARLLLARGQDDVLGPCERLAFSAAEAEHAPVEGRTQAYLNRLSDLLFAWARLANHLAGVQETKWTGAASNA